MTEETKKKKPRKKKAKARAKSIRKVKKERGLTEPARLFCHYLLADPDYNAKKAYMKAFPKAAEKSAENAAWRIQTRPAVAKYLMELKNDRCSRIQVDADWLLRRLHDEVEADIGDIFDEQQNSVKPIHKWPKIMRQGLVSSIEVEELTNGRGEDKHVVGQIVKVKFVDRTPKLKQIGDHVNVQAFKSQVSHTGEVLIFNNDYGRPED